jgi:hypothetical protein
MFASIQHGKPTEQNLRESAASICHLGIFHDLQLF